jgi:outer membrane protease
MRKTIVVYLAFMLVLGLAENAFAERPDVRLSAGIGYLQGETTYQIGGHFDSPQLGSGDYSFPISELAWPLNVAMGSVDLTASYWRLSGAASYRINLSDPKQKMEDSDWGAIEGDSVDLLDIYSESSTTLNAKIFDGNVNFAFLKYSGWDMQIGLGYLWQDFSFVASDLDQWYPPYPTEPHVYVSGRVGTYDVTYKVPYAELILNFYTKKFKGAFTYQFSPFVNAEDEDHHLLRSIESHGYSDGYMNVGRFNCTYDITNHFFAGLDFSLRQIQTTGYERQHHAQYFDIRGGFHPEWWGDIDNEIFSDQIESTLKVGYKF